MTAIITLMKREFPSTGNIRQLTWERKVVRQAKDMLKAGPEKYDVILRTAKQ